MNHEKSPELGAQVIQELKVSYGNYKQITSVLRLTRESYGIHQKQAAVIMDMTQSAISKLEMGLSDPPFSTFMKYASILGYDISLLKRKGDEDELSLFYVRRHKIARTLPDYYDIKLRFPFININDSVIKEVASDIVRRLSEIRAQMEKGISDLCKEYVKVRKITPSPELNVPRLTIKQMAGDLGVSHMTIRRFEQGDADAVTTNMVFQYADRLNIWLGLYESKYYRNEEPWEHYALTFEMLPRTANTVLLDRMDQGL